MDNQLSELFAAFPERLVVVTDGIVKFIGGKGIGQALKFLIIRFAKNFRNNSVWIKEKVLTIILSMILNSFWTN